MPSERQALKVCQAILANFPELEHLEPYRKTNLVIADENVSFLVADNLDYVAYMHKVTSVNNPFRNLGLYKGMTDGELIDIAELNGNAPIVTKDAGLIYEKTILIPSNGHKEKESYILESVGIVLGRLHEYGFEEYKVLLDRLDQIKELNSNNLSIGISEVPKLT